jgi:hypothetical protein
VAAVLLLGGVGAALDGGKDKKSSAAGSTQSSVLPSSTAPSIAPKTLTAAERAAASRSAVAQAAADKAAAAAAAKSAAVASKAAVAAAKAAAAAKARAERPVAISSRSFAKLVKNPDAYAGRHYYIYGTVTQFDAATGTDAFLADTGAKKLYPEYGFVEYSQNAFFQGDASDLTDVVEGDVFMAVVEVVGSYSYDTQAGGNTTVPEFRVQRITRYASTS